jgi:Tfp pilus assembly protein PilN
MRAVNLIPTEQRKGGTVGARSQGAAFAVLGLLAGVAALTFLYGSADHRLESRRAEAASLTARAQQVRVQAAKLSAYSSFMQMREQRLQEMAQLIDSRFDWSSAMGELSRVLPSYVVLNSLQATVGSKTAAATPASASASAASSASASAAPVSSTTPPGVVPTFTLSGCAASQAAVAQTLVRLRLMSGVSNVTLQSSTKSGSGSSSGGSGGGACEPAAPAFTVNVAFQPLPSPPATSTETLESTVARQGAGGAHDRTVSSTADGAGR